MWTDLLIFLPMLLALVAVALVIWLRREGRKDADADVPDQEAKRGGGGPRPVLPQQ